MARHGLAKNAESIARLKVGVEFGARARRAAEALDAAVWLALGASDLRAGIDKRLAWVVSGFALGAQACHAYIFGNRAADRVKMLAYNGGGMWLCTRRLKEGSFAWPQI